MDRIEKIKKLQKEGYKKNPKQSMIINNFYALATIVTISVAIILYTRYIVPPQLEKKEKEQQLAKERQEYIEYRKKQIELSHKLNKLDNKEYKENNDTNKK